MKRVVTIAVIALYVFFIAGFLYFDNINRIIQLSNLFKYITVVLSFLTAAFLWKDSFDRYDGTLLVIALFLKVIIDIFLVMISSYRNYVIGMALYGVNMSVYFMRYQYKRPKNALVLPFFLIIPLVFCLLSTREWFFLHGDSQRMLIIVTTYYIQAIIAVIVSLIREVRRGRYPATNARLILSSMGFFIISDIIVVLRNWDVFRNYINQPLVGRLIFLFYTPSLALMAFSAYDFSKHKNHKNNLPA